MLRFWLSLSALFVLVASTKYVPGTPGAAWTEEEMVIVKAKLYSIFDSSGGFKAVNQLPGNPHADWREDPDAAKMLRLAFHDCLK